MLPFLPRVLLVAVAAATLSAQQLYPTSISPPVLSVGSAATATVSNSYPAGLTGLWNGSPRPTSSASSGVTTYTLQLTAADLATPQLATLTLVDRTGAVVDTVNYPVGYNVQPTGIALDRLHNRLYLATPPASPDSQFPSNSLVIIDTTSGKISSSFPIGAALGDVAISDDGSALYLAIEGLSVVRRFNPDTMAAVGDFNFRAAGYKPPSNIVASDMLTVMPGQPLTVALYDSPQAGVSTTELAIYDNGVKRPNIVSTCCGFSGMLFSPDGKFIFENGTSTFQTGPSSFDYLYETFRHPVDPSGISAQKPLAADGGAPVTIVGNTLYTNLGHTATFVGNATTAIDYSTMTVTGNFPATGPIAVDSDTNRAFVLFTPPPISSGGNTPPTELIALALPGLQPLGAQSIGVTSIVLKESEKLLHFGSDGFIIPSTGGLLLFHSPLDGPAPSTSAAAVVNAASQQSGSIAPGEILTIYGANLASSAPQVGVLQNGAFPFILNHVEVSFNGLPGAPILVSQGQINVVAPFELVPGSAISLQVLNYGIPSPLITLSVAAAAPALFTQNGSGSGAVAVINQDGTVNTASASGSIVTLFGTGGGSFAGSADGQTARRPVSLANGVHVTIAGRDAQVLYAGTAPGLTQGVFQLNVMVPAATPTGAAAIIVNIGGQNSPQGATLAIL